MTISPNESCGRRPLSGAVGMELLSIEASPNVIRGIAIVLKVKMKKMSRETCMMIVVRMEKFTNKIPRCRKLAEDLRWRKMGGSLVDPSCRQTWVVRKRRHIYGRICGVFMWCWCPPFTCYDAIDRLMPHHFSYWAFSALSSTALAFHLRTCWITDGMKIYVPNVHTARQTQLLKLRSFLPPQRPPPPCKSETCSLFLFLSIIQIPNPKSPIPVLKFKVWRKTSPRCGWSK